MKTKSNAEVLPENPNEKHRIITIRCDNGCEVVFVKGGPRAYLRIGGTDGEMVVAITGSDVLRSLANAILDELKEK